MRKGDQRDIHQSHQINLARTDDVLRVMHGLASPDMQPAVDWSLGGKRLILAVTPGRSGTGYLSQLLDGLPDVFSAHEPEPNFRDAMRPAQSNPTIARAFLLEKKLPTIRSCVAPVYLETSHLACKGFIEPLVENGCVPDLILLKRDPYRVASSLIT
jgi:hypothetical protein